MTEYEGIKVNPNGQSPSQLKPRQISEQELVEMIGHDLAINLAAADLEERKADLKESEARLQRVNAKAGAWRAKLQSTYRLVPGEDHIDYETRLITKAEPTTPPKGKG